MRKFRMLQNERGVALMMVLLIATITLAVTTTMLYMLTQSTRYSGLQKRYASANEAAIAGSAVITDFITYKGGDTVFRQNYATAIGLNTVLSADCLADKLNEHTKDWRGCDDSMLMDPASAATYDTHFLLGNYKVMTKIVYTIKGNTAQGTSERRFTNTCVVHCEGGGAGDFASQVIPATYIVEVDARNTSNPEESSKITVLFQY